MQKLIDAINRSEEDFLFFAKPSSLPLIRHILDLLNHQQEKVFYVDQYNSDVDCCWMVYRSDGQTITMELRVCKTVRFEAGEHQSNLLATYHRKRQCFVLRSSNKKLEIVFKSWGFLVGYRKF